MRKLALLLSFQFLAGIAISLPVEASKTKHKPWFSNRPATVKVASKKVTKRRPVYQTTATRPTANPASTPHKGQEIVLQAKKYQGTRYRYGGTSKSKGFDCSGLVARVWADLNLKKVPRSSSGLYQAGMPVRLTDLQEGDLVFFKNTYKRGVSHVGVYAGKNKFIHAPSSGKRVSITRLSDPYYQLHYAGARRLY